MKILRPKQSQQKIGCGHTTFYELIAQGKLPPPVRYGRITGHLEGGDRRLHRSAEGRARLQAEGHRSGPRRFPSNIRPINGPALRAVQCRAVVEEDRAWPVLPLP